MNLKDIRRNYENFDDSKIERIASEEASGLSPEVLDILKAEILKRNLQPNLVDSVNSQTKEITDIEFKEYCAILQNHPCPICFSNRQELNVAMIGKVVSIVFFTSYEKSLRIACPKCLDILYSKALTKSAIFGWWAIPWGPINTMRSVVYNSQMRREYKVESPNEYFIGFVLGNIGILEKAKTEPESLTIFLNRING